MIPTIIDFGFFGIHSFGLMMVLAFVAAWRRLSLSLIWAKQNPSIAEDMIFWGALGGIIGARVGFILSYPEQLLQDPVGAIFSGAGFIYHWGFIVGALALWILSKKRKFDFLSYADLSAPAIAVGYAIGRIGCQLSGDGDYGIESSVPWAMGYPQGVIPTAPGLLVHPTPVYETIACLFIAWVLVKITETKRLEVRGAIFGLFLIFMSLERFLIEFLRIEPIFWLGMTQAQVVSVVLSIAGLLMILRRNSLTA